MPSENVGMTGDQNINAILSGVKWSGTVVTYGWPLAASEYGTGDDYDQTYDHDNNPATPDVTVNESDGFFALNPMQQVAVEAAFLEFRRVTNMSALRQEPAAGADIRVAMSTTMEPGATTAYAAYPSDTQFGGDSWFTTANYNTPRLGTFAYQTFFHEMGHALGLKHGHETDNGNMNVMTAARNSLEFSTMTYADYIGQPTGAGSSVTSGHSPQTFMMYDIAALQHMYGADFTDGAHSGATVYWFDPNNGQTVVNGVGQGIPQNDAGTNVNVIFRTIWDGGGSDTYDFSAYGADRQLDVDLAPGSWTDVDSDSNFQAADLDRTDPGTEIARGQIFNALLYNGDTRSLIENAIGGFGDDWIKGNQAQNHLQGRDGRDILEGFDGADTLDQGAGGGELYGGNGSDVLWASEGVDWIDGGNDFDIVNYSRSTAEIVIDPTIGKVAGGWAFNDTLISIEGVVGTSKNDNIALGNEDNQIWGGGGADGLNGGAGNDDLEGGLGADLFVFKAGDGADRISDFVVDTDHLLLNGITIGSTSEIDGNSDGVLDTLVTFSGGGTALLSGVTGVTDPGDLIA